MNIYLNFTIPGVLFLGMVLFGVWLGMNGKPYNTAIFTVHKLLAVAFIVLASIKLMPYCKTVSVSDMLLFLLIVAVLSIIGLFASGAAMSIITGSKPILFWLHRLFSLSLMSSLFGVLELLKANGLQLAKKMFFNY